MGDRTAVTGRGVWWLLSSAGIGNLADGLTKVAFPLLATTITRDPMQIGALSATQFLPWLLLGTVAGALVDRVDRRHAMVVANTGRAAIAALTALLSWTGSASIWLVYLAALLLGVAETVAESAANAVIPAVVERDRLDGANGRFQAAEIIGQTFLGGPVGSATFALFAALPFLLSSAGFAVGAALLLGLAGTYRPRSAGRPTRLRADLGDGMRWLRRNPLVLRLVLVAGLISMTSELAQAQLVLYALDDLRLSAAAFGLFSLIGGLGGILGAAAAPWLTRRAGRAPVLIGGILVAGAGFLAMGILRHPLLAGLSFGLFAAAIVTVNVIFATARHSLVPDDLLGRVLGAWRTVVWGAVPIGALAGGGLARGLGSASATFAVSGAAQLGLAGFAVLMLRGFTLDGNERTAA